MKDHTYATTGHPVTGKIIHLQLLVIQTQERSYICNYWSSKHRRGHTSATTVHPNTAEIIHLHLLVFLTEERSYTCNYWSSKHRKYHTYAISGCPNTGKIHLQLLYWSSMDTGKIIICNYWSSKHRRGRTSATTGHIPLRTDEIIHLHLLGIKTRKKVFRHCTKYLQ
jgi:hypothetical protein